MLVTRIALKEDSVVLMGKRTECTHVLAAPSNDIYVDETANEEAFDLALMHISYNDWLNFKAEMGPISIPFTYK